MEHQLRLSEDGSHTIFSPVHGDTYHSMHGAIAESRHIFIELGLKSQLPHDGPLHLLELGWGSGLNTLLTLEALSGMNQALFYHGVEAFPLSPEIVQQLNYSALTGLDLFPMLHALPWNQDLQPLPGFAFFKELADIRSFQPHMEAYDLVYFDAFAPSLQEELWTEDVFRRIFACCGDGAVLVTYSSRGSVRRALKAAGFKVEKHPGPAGKREVVRAIK